MLILVTSKHLHAVVTCSVHLMVAASSIAGRMTAMSDLHQSFTTFADDGCV